MILRPLQPHDDRSAFSCGDVEYDRYLRVYAGQNQFRHRIGTTIVIAEDDVVIGYATVAVGEVSRDQMPEDAARRLPQYPLPVLRLARLAVDVRFQGLGLGRQLLRAVLELALRLRAEVGCVAIVVDALEASTGFYCELGFEEVQVVFGGSRVPGTVMMALPLATAEAALPPV